MNFLTILFCETSHALFPLNAKHFFDEIYLMLLKIINIYEIKFMF